MAAKDLLQRDKFLAFVTEAIETKIQSKEPYSFAIDGKWGCGKTFILDRLEERLKGEYLVVRYNAWEHDYYDEPLISLLSVFADTLNNDQTIEHEKGNADKDKVINEVLKGSAKIAGKFIAKAALKIIEKRTGISSKDVKNLGRDLAKTISDAKKILPQNEIEFHQANKSLPIDNLIEQVKNAIGLLFIENHPIILLVDELDRCLPDYAIKVLERLHHVCEGTRIVQVIAYDKENLNGSIRKSFGKESFVKDAKDYFADDYLQKFVQYTMRLGEGTINDENLSLFKNSLKLFDFSNQIDKDALIKFEKQVLAGIPMRSVKRIIQNVNLTHQMTLRALGKTGEDGRQIFRPHFFITELLIGTCYLHFHKNPADIELFQNKSQDNGAFSTSLRVIRDKEDSISKHQIVQNIEKYFCEGCSLLRGGNPELSNSGIIALIKIMFVKEKALHEIYIDKNWLNKTKKDLEFISNFNTILSRSGAKV